MLIFDLGHRFTQINTDPPASPEREQWRAGNYFLKLSKTLRLISGLGPKFNKRPTSTSVAFR
jgi:hypothetical protein